MKKTYISPNLQCFKIVTSSLLANSPTSTIENDDNVNGSDAMSKSFKGGFLWDNEEK